MKKPTPPQKVPVKKLSPSSLSGGTGANKRQLSVLMSQRVTRSGSARGR